MIKIKSNISIFAKSFTTVSLLTVVSKMFGMTREILMANIIGASWIKDAMIIAITVPSLLRRILAEGAFSAVFIPNYTHLLNTKGQDVAKQYAGNILSILFIIITLLLIAMEFFAPQVLRLIAPGYDHNSEKFTKLIIYTRICLPFLLLIFLNSFYSGILNAHTRFQAMALSPTIGNIACIGVLLTPIFFDVTMDYGFLCCIGIILCGIAQVCCVLIPTYRTGLMPMPLVNMIKINWRNNRPHISVSDNIYQTFDRLASVATGYGIAQINAVIARIIGSFLGEGAISFLYYAEKLYLMPVSVIGAALSSTLLPLMSRSLSNNEHDKVNKLQLYGINCALFFGIATSITLFVIAPDIIKLIFERGKFSASDTYATAQSLRAYSISIPAYLLIKVFSTSFYVRKITRPPLIAALIAIVTEVSLSLILIHVFNYGYISIAWGSTFAAYCSTLYLFLQLDKHGMWQQKKFSVFYATKLLCCCVIVIASMYFTTHLTHMLGSVPSSITALMILALSIISLGITSGVGHVLKLVNIYDIMNLKKKESK